MGEQSDAVLRTAMPGHDEVGNATCIMSDTAYGSLPAQGRLYAACASRICSAITDAINSPNSMK